MGQIADILKSSFQNTCLSSKNWGGEAEGQNIFQSNVASIYSFLYYQIQPSNILSSYMTAPETLFVPEILVLLFPGLLTEEGRLLWYTETMISLRYKRNCGTFLVNGGGSRDKERLLFLTGIKANKAQVPSDVFSGKVWDSRLEGLSYKICREYNRKRND